MDGVSTIKSPPARELYLGSVSRLIVKYAEATAIPAACRLPSLNRSQRLVRILRQPTREVSMQPRTHRWWLYLTLFLPALFAIAGAPTSRPAGVATSEPTLAPGAGKERMESSIYTGVYKTREDGAYLLPADVHWRVEPQYHGVGAEGKEWTDDRLTIVLEDTPNHFWPVIVKMSLDEAEKFQRELAFRIAEKKKEQKDGKAK